MMASVSMWTLVWSSMALVLASSWAWRRRDAGLVVPMAASFLGALLLIGGLVLDPRFDPDGWTTALGLLGGLLPGSFMLSLALLARGERRRWLYWPAALAGMAFLGCVFLLLLALIAPRGRMLG